MARSASWLLLAGGPTERRSAPMARSELDGAAPRGLAADTAADALEARVSAVLDAVGALVRGGEAARGRDADALARELADARRELAAAADLADAQNVMVATLRAELDGQRGASHRASNRCADSGRNGRSLAVVSGMRSRSAEEGFASRPTPSTIIRPKASPPHAFTNSPATRSAPHRSSPLVFRAAVAPRRASVAASRRSTAPADVSVATSSLDANAAATQRVSVAIVATASPRATPTASTPQASRAPSSLQARPWTRHGSSVRVRRSDPVFAS